jgi:hypothetical protein
MFSVKSIGFNFLISIPLIFLLVFWYIFSVDIPFYDDVMVLAFNRNISIQGFNYLTFKQLFANYNEHIIVTTKLIFWLNYKVFGYINISYVAFQGLIFYLIFILLFIKYAAGQNNYVKLFIVFMLTSLIYDEGYLWAMSNIQNFASLLFTFLSIVYISRKKIKWSFFFLFLGIISSAQTLVIIPIWLLALVYIKKFNWNLIGLLIIILIFYFSGYQNTGLKPELNAFLNSFTKSRILNILTFYTPPFGSLGKTFTIVYFCFEFLLLLFVLYNIILDYRKTQLTAQKIIVASTLLWASSIVFLTFIVRVEIESRYLLYSILKTTCVYLYLFLMSTKLNLAKTLVPLSIFFYLTTFFPSIVKAKNWYVGSSSLKFNLLKNKKTFFFGTDDVDARQVEHYYIDLKPNEIINIPNRLNGRIFNHLLLFNQISNEQINSPKFNKHISPLISQNLQRPMLIGKNIKIDSLSPFIVYENKLSASNLLDTYFILLKSKEYSLLFNYQNELKTFPQFAINDKFENKIVINKITIPYGQYDMYFIQNSLKWSHFYSN